MAEKSVNTNMAEKAMDTQGDLGATKSQDGEVMEYVEPYDEKKLVRRIDIL